MPKHQIPSRTRVAALINEHLVDFKKPDSSAYHYGKQELRILLDFIYGGPPTRKSQHIKGDKELFGE